MRIVLCAVVLAIMPQAASAAWVKTTLGTPGMFMTEVSSPNGADVFVAGSSIALSGNTPNITTKVWASSDGGATYTELTSPWGVQSGFTAAMGSALFFVDASTGWLALGTKIWKTASRGAEWSSATVTFTARDLHFFDGSRGVAVADDGAIFTTANGGASWTPASSPGTSDLRQMFWVDGLKGWAIGYDEVDIEVSTGDGTTSYVAPDNAQLLKTVDGGVNWTLLDTGDDVAFSAVWFSDDGLTGWLGQWSRPSESEYQVALAKTVNGGGAFTPVSIPVKVGTASFGIFSGDINVAHLHAIQLAGTRGRMVATAFVGEESSSMGGSGMPSTTQKARNMKLVDYVTSDSGATWTPTQLGTITVSTTAGQTPNDGEVQDAQLWGLTRGWVATSKQGAWRDNASCAAQIDCGDGFTCSSGVCERSGSSDGCGGTCSGGDVCVGGSCVAPTDDCAPACSDGQVCVDGSCRTQDVGSVGNSPGSTTPTGGVPEDEGCAASRVGLLPALGVLALALRRRRRA